MRSFGWIGWCLLPLVAAGPARPQDSPPVEVVDVDLRTSESAATIVLSSQEPAQWTAEAGGRKLVVFLPRTVPGPSALDRSSRAGLVSLVEVGFAVPKGVPTTRITVHSRKAFEYELEGTQTGLTIRLSAAEAPSPARAEARPSEQNASGAEALDQDDLEAALQENELLRRRMAELHADRLELRNSLEEARRQLASASDGASPERLEELELENARLFEEIEGRNAELTQSRRAIEELSARSDELSAQQALLAESRKEAAELRARIDGLEQELASVRTDPAPTDLETRLADSRQREAALAEKLRRSRADSTNLRAWLNKAPDVLQASRFSVGPGESCLSLRPEPAETSAVLECLPVGAPLEALSFRPDWLRVRAGEGKEGWVRVAGVTPMRPEIENLEARVSALSRELEAERSTAPAADTTAMAELEKRVDREASARESAEAALASARDRIAQLEQDLGRLGEDETGKESALAALEADFVSARSQSEADQRRLRALLAEIDRQQLSVSRAVDPCLTVRAGPSTDQARLDCVEPGVALSVKDAAEGWLSVRTPGGVSGWVASRFVAASASDESAGQIAALEGELAASRQQSEGLAARLVALGTELEANAIAARRAAEAGEAERAAMAAELEEANRQTRETLEQLEQVRAKRTEAEEALAALTERQQLERAEALGALKVSKAVVEDDVDPCLSFREKPEVGSRALDCLAPGTEVETVALAGGWFRLRLEDGREGWSSGEFLESAEQRELRELRNRLADRDASLADLESRLASAQQGSSEAERLDRNLQASRQEVVRVMQELAEAERLRTEGEQQVADLSQEVERLGALAGRAGEVPLLESALEQTRGALEASEAKVRELEQERVEAPSPELEAELAQLRSRLAVANKSLEEVGQESERELARLRSELAGARESLETSREESEDELARLRSELAAVRESLEASGEESEGELARLRAELATTSESLAASQSANAELRADLSKSAAEQSRLETVEDRSLAFKQRIDSLQTELSASRRSLAESETRIRTLESETAQLSDAREQVKTARSERDEFARRLAELEAGQSSVQTTEVLEPLPATARAPDVAEGGEDISSSTPPAPLPAEPLPSREPSPAPAPGPEVLAADLEALARAWAQAWSEQRVDDYLSFYGEAFVPPGGASREDWESIRRDRLSRPEFIEVEVSNVRTEISGPDRATVTFDQRYRSNTFQDQVVKTLELAREGDLWKIVVEEAS